MQRMDPREAVCRSLFGPVDHDQLRRDLVLKLREMEEQDCRRWNFHFQTETPLSGRFQWEEIPADCAPVVYQEEEEEEEEEEEDRLSAGTDQENRSSVSNTHKCPAEVTPVRRKRMLSKPAAKPGCNYARITDFFAKRRRTTETKSIQNPFHTSSSEAASCKTIR
ncbi:cyclin-dependent kinase inhibitor 1Ca [Anoplopoma fimbria]|uniref:cyclin-dependent kinase inhibitor 1Ca n=1 Tax=Anoplopoma fimbria TaxID=229290 RepID=UPI0023EABB00|nr:cyclin-dependent kinase inhibitor 1Ca [Anoplopoma fimbria]